MVCGLRAEEGEEENEEEEEMHSHLYQAIQST